MSAAPLPRREQELDERDQRILIARLRRFRRMAMRGEEQRRANDRKGAKLFSSKMWESGIMQGRLPITANQAVALCERFLDMLAKNNPAPDVRAKSGAADSAADLLEGALLTNWQKDRMQFKTRVGGRLAMFTRPILGYTFWDEEKDGGRGDVSTRLIPAHRCIIDQRHLLIDDMEFKGFSERMTRAKTIMLFPDKADEIEMAIAAKDRSGEPSLRSDPLDMQATGPGASPDAVTRLVESEGSDTFVGTQSLKYSGRRKSDPYAEEIDVEFLWLNDPSPVMRKKPKLDRHGFPVYRLERDDDDNVIYDVTGHDVFNHPLIGPMYVPKVEPRRRLVTEDHIEKKYRHTRHIAWIPQDDVILWDVAWDGPTPLSVLRANVPLWGYWIEGPALRLSSLAIARNVLYTIIFTRLKLSMSGTYLATPQSGLKRNKLTAEDGQVFYAHKIDEQNVRQFPVQPVDAAYFQLLDRIENEMMQLIGMTGPMKGEAEGRADSSSTYEVLLETGGSSLVGAGQLLEMFVEDWARIASWWMQKRYTSEHYVEIMDESGSTWKQASALALRGDFAITVETGSMASYSESARIERAKQYLGDGVYALPMYAEMAHIPRWRKALRQKGALLQTPGEQWMAGGMPQGAGQTRGPSPQPPNKRSHHKKTP